METEIVFNGENELMQSFEALFQKHELVIAAANSSVKASEKLPKRYSQTVSGKAYNMAMAILDLLSKKTEYEASIEVGEKITIVTRQDSAGDIEKTVSSHRGVRVLFKRKE